MSEQKNARRNRSQQAAGSLFSRSRCSGAPTRWSN